MKYRSIKKVAYEAIVQGFAYGYDDVQGISCNIDHYCDACPAYKYCGTCYDTRFRLAIATIFKDHLELRI